LPIISRFATTRQPVATRSSNVIIAFDYLGWLLSGRNETQSRDFRAAEKSSIVRAVGSQGKTNRNKPLNLQARVGDFKIDVARNLRVCFSKIVRIFFFILHHSRWKQQCSRCKPPLCVYKAHDSCRKIKRERGHTKKLKNRYLSRENSENSLSFVSRLLFPSQSCTNHINMYNSINRAFFI